MEGLTFKAGWLKIVIIQSSPFVVLPKYSVNPPTRSTNSYPALQIFTCYRVSPVTLPDFGGPDGVTISGLDCTTKPYAYILDIENS